MSLLIVGLDNTIVNVALPSIGKTRLGAPRARPGAGRRRRRPPSRRSRRRGREPACAHGHFGSGR
jgi:hypothetical protein